jgi:hypothetical protein
MPAAARPARRNWEGHLVNIAVIGIGGRVVNNTGVERRLGH